LPLLPPAACAALPLGAERGGGCRLLTSLARKPTARNMARSKSTRCASEPCRRWG